MLIRSSSFKPSFSSSSTPVRPPDAEARAVLSPTSEGSRTTLPLGESGGLTIMDLWSSDSISMRWAFLASVPSPGAGPNSPARRAIASRISGSDWLVPPWSVRNSSCSRSVPATAAVVSSKISSPVLLAGDAVGLPSLSCISCCCRCESIAAAIRIESG